VKEDNPKRLIVEGPDDLFSVVGLMRAHVDWPEEKEKAPVWIEKGGSEAEILEFGYLTAKIKTRDIRVLGVMLDADASPRGRYERVRQLCSPLFPAFPAELSSSGLICQNDEDQKRFGLWIMPDNSSEGSLETFLKHLIPGESELLWKHAIESVSAARTIGAKCREAHSEKANLYTWLAWQDPPGQSPGTSLKRKILDPRSAGAEPFVKWFCELFSL
jgi:hypothetical protein